MSNLVTTAIATGGTSFDIATCIGGFKTDPFAVYDSTGLLYHHDMLQTKTEYQPLSLNTTMEASTSKPTRSPFADDALAYFVGDDNFQDAGQGLVRFRRTFSRVPTNYKEPYGLFNRLLPSITATNFYSYYTAIAGPTNTQKNDDALYTNPLLADDCTLEYFFGTRSTLETAGDSFTGMTATKTFTGSDNDDSGNHIFSLTGTFWDGTNNRDNLSHNGKWQAYSNYTRSNIDTLHYRAKFTGKLNLVNTEGATPHEWVDNTGVYLDVGFKCILIQGNDYVNNFSTGAFPNQILFETNANGFGNKEGRSGLCVLMPKRQNNGDLTIHHCNDWNSFVITEIDRSNGTFTAITDIRSDVVDHFNAGLTTNDNNLASDFYISVGSGSFTQTQFTHRSDYTDWASASFNVRGIAFSTGQTRAFTSHKNLPARISYRFIKSDNLDNMSLAGVFDYPDAITETSVPNNQNWATLTASNFYSAENEFIERYYGNIYRIGQMETRLE